MNESKPSQLQRQFAADHRARRARLNSREALPSKPKPSMAELYSDLPVDYMKAISVALCLLEKEDADKSITIRKIQDAICRAANIHRNELLSPRRAPDVATPRQIAMALCKELTQTSFPEIGRRFNRDHSTAIYSVERMRPLMAALKDILDCGDLNKIAETAMIRSKKFIPERKYRNGARP